MAAKTYVLTEVMDADAPIYQQVVGGQRVQVKKIPFHRPTLRQTFQDKDGIGKTIRYKANAVDAEGKAIVDQRVQIDKLKIDANERFTTSERKDLMFRNAVLVTNKVVAQEYLESHPEFEGFEGTCDDVRQPRYRLLDKEKESKIKNSDIRKRVKAANKIIDLDLEDAQNMLIRLNGSFFETPKNIEDCQNLLMEFIDDAEEAGLDAVLMGDEEINLDEKTTILIGKLINAGILSFDAVEGTISKKDKNGKWIKLRDMSAEYSLEERERLFSDFLNTESGKLLKADLENDLKALNKTEEGDQIKKSGRPKKES